MKCIVHVGAPKTGTTSLQNYLNNPQNLQDTNVQYVSAGRKFGEKFFNRHIGLLLALYPVDLTPPVMMSHVGLTTQEERKNYANRFEEELDAELEHFDSNATAIFSDEELFNFTTDDITCSLKRVLEIRFDEIEILAFVRNPVSYVSSAYVQSVRIGNKSSPEQFCEMLVENTLYSGTLSKWADAFGNENVRVEWYDGENVVERFADRLSLREPSDKDLRYRNVSMSSAAVEVLRQMNEFGPHELQFQLLLRSVCEKVRGEKWTVTRELADFIVNSSDRELDEIARKYQFEGASIEKIRKDWVNVPPLSGQVDNGKKLQEVANALFKRVHSGVQQKLTGYVPAMHPWIL